MFFSFLIYTLRVYTFIPNKMIGLKYISYDLRRSCHLSDSYLLSAPIIV